jgi:hypothetical protein
MVVVELVAPPYLEAILNLIPSTPPTPDARSTTLCYSHCVSQDTHDGIDMTTNFVLTLGRASGSKDEWLGHGRAPYTPSLDIRRSPNIRIRQAVRGESHGPTGRSHI